MSRGAAQSFRDGIKFMISDMVEKGDIPFEARMKAMESVLFKTS